MGSAVLSLLKRKNSRSLPYPFLKEAVYYLRLYIQVVSLFLTCTQPKCTRCTDKEYGHGKYSPFHKTLPKSSLKMHWISVRFYEMGDTKRREFLKGYYIFPNRNNIYCLKQTCYLFVDSLTSPYIVYTKYTYIYNLFHVIVHTNFLRKYLPHNMLL